MRDFRDAKTMAQTLRESLTARAVTISHSESLELVSKMLGVADWNTLSAMLKTDQRAPGSAAGRQRINYPAIPIRDLVPFPAMTFPLFAGREKTMRALDAAFAGEQKIVLAVQREAGVDEPSSDDVYGIGVLATMLEVQRLPDGTMKVLAHADRRVVVRRLMGETGAWQAEIGEIDEQPVADTAELITAAATRFNDYAAAHGIAVVQTWPPLDRSRDAGQVADIIARHLVLPIRDKQGLLETLDPLARLEKVHALMAQNPAPVEPQPG